MSLYLCWFDMIGFIIFCNNQGNRLAYQIYKAISIYIICMCLCVCMLILCINWLEHGTQFWGKQSLNAAAKIFFRCGYIQTSRCWVKQFTLHHASGLHLTNWKPEEKRLRCPKEEGILPPQCLRLRHKFLYASPACQTALEI